MARPQPTIIMSTRLQDVNQLDILQADGLWAVVYKDQPINVRKTVLTLQGESFKYQRGTYPSPAPARILAEKLNELFYCTDFAVVKIL